MRKKLFVTGLLAVFPVVIVGCQSTSQMAWWKSANKSDIESTTIARSAAPQLPSEVAKQGEKLAANNATDGQISASQAAPPALAASNSLASSSPGTAPTAPSAAYPSTAYPSTIPANTKHPSTTVASARTTLASAQTPYPTTQAPAPPAAATQVSAMTMPYDPTAVPASKGPASGTGQTTTASLATFTTQNANRYGISTPVANSQAVASAPASTVPASTSAVIPNQNLSSDAGGSYATTNQPGYRNQAGSNTHITSILPTSNTVAGIPYPTTTEESTTDAKTTAFGSNQLVSESPQLSTQASANGMATNGSFRPGGTSNYPGATASASPPRVATRIERTTPTLALTGESQLPYAAPSTQQPQVPVNSSPTLGTRY
ncbi:MAG: hypothetical protein ABGX16_05505 [Pirellulales bacterium]